MLASDLCGVPLPAELNEGGAVQEAWATAAIGEQNGQQSNATAEKLATVHSAGRLDVNDDGFVTPQDALVIANCLQEPALVSLDPDALNVDVDGQVLGAANDRLCR
jgi:hypothetical protein